MARGAGDGVKVMLMKRHEASPHHRKLNQIFGTLFKTADIDDATLTSRGHSPAEQMASTIKRKETTPRDRTTELSSFIKSGDGMTAVAKHIIDKGSTSVTELEFTQMLQEHANLNKRAGEVSRMIQGGHS